METHSFLEAVKGTFGSGTREEQLAATAKLLSKSVVNGQLADFLRFRLASAADLALLSGYSYDHPNGFDKYTLSLPLAVEPVIRLHVWRNKGYGTGDANPHTHVRDFVSIVIRGKLEDEVYSEELRAAYGPFIKCEVQERSSDDDYKPKRIAQAFLKQVLREKVGPLQTYTRSGAVVHRTNITECPVVTCFVQSPLRTPTSLAYVIGDPSDTRNAGGRRFTIEEIRTAIEFALDAID